jgi:iron(III) transport system substrate-binding protein
MNKSKIFAFGSGVIAISALIIGSSHAATQTLTIYSGRSTALVDPIVQRFKAETGIDVKIRYATDATLFATLEEEATNSPADVFWVNTSGTLVNAAQKDFFNKLPSTITKRAIEFAPKSGLWTPLSARFRVIAFNPKTVKKSELPQSVLDMTKLAKFKGRIGWTPLYSSFQDFVTALRSVYGEASAKQWLLDMKNLEPKTYPNNPSMMNAIQANEIDIALTNHYYVQRILAVTPKVLGTHFFKSGDVGNLELVTGAGILKTSKNIDAATKFLEFMLSTKNQKTTTETTFEYPVVRGFVLPKTLVPLSVVFQRGPKIEFEKLSDIEGSLKLLRDVGLL